VYTFTGNDALLNKTSLLGVTDGSFIVTGANVEFTYNENNDQFTLTLTAGEFDISGQNAMLTKANVLNLATGSFNFSGIDADFRQTKLLNLEQGACVVTGHDLNTKRGYGLSAQVGSFSYTGNPANLIRASLLITNTGQFILTGYDVVLRTFVYIPIQTPLRAVFLTGGESSAQTSLSESAVQFAHSTSRADIALSETSVQLERSNTKAVANG
jgi:hypothetical protein